MNNMTENPLLVKEWKDSGFEVIHHPCGGGEDHDHRVWCGCSGDGHYYKVSVVGCSEADDILRNGRLISVEMAEFGECLSCGSGIHTAVSSYLYLCGGSYYRVKYNPIYGACSCCGAV